MASQRRPPPAPQQSGAATSRGGAACVSELGTSFDGGCVPRELQSNFQMSCFSRMVPGTAPALGRCRVRLAPDLSKQPPACGRIFFNSAREGTCWCTRGGCAPRDLGAAAPFFAAQPPRICSGTRNEFRRRLCSLTACSQIFKCRAFRAWSRGPRPPSGAVGCASRPTCRNNHRPAAAFFQLSPRGRVLVHPGAGALPGTSALPRHERGPPRSSGPNPLQSKFPNPALFVRGGLI
jgi:hypothetical protein